jgi:hypothetical protein
VPIPAAGMTALVTVPGAGKDEVRCSVEIMAQTLVGQVLAAAIWPRPRLDRGLSPMRIPGDSDAVRPSHHN